jgi:hypothetical protein
MNEPFTTYHVTNSPFAAYAYLDPELQIGVQLSERFDLGVGVQALLLFALSQPRFSEKLELAAGPSIGTYPNDALTGRIVFLLVPGVSARYAF